MTKRGSRSRKIKRRERSDEKNDEKKNMARKKTTILKRREGV